MYISPSMIFDKAWRTCISSNLDLDELQGSLRGQADACEKFDAPHGKPQRAMPETSKNVIDHL